MLGVASGPFGVQSRIGSVAPRFRPLEHPELTIPQKVPEIRQSLLDAILCTIQAPDCRTDAPYNMSRCRRVR